MKRVYWLTRTGIGESVRFQEFALQSRRSRPPIAAVPRPSKACCFSDCNDTL